MCHAKLYLLQGLNLVHPGRVCRRPGRPGASKACGALVGALGEIKGNGLAPSCVVPGGEMPRFGSHLFCQQLVQGVIPVLLPHLTNQMQLPLSPALHHMVH